MGVYYLIVNVDKKELLSPHDFDHGAKMAEWCYQGNRVILALHNLLENRWKGDRVYAVSDYALASYDSRYKAALSEALRGTGAKSLYAYASEHYTPLGPEDTDIEDHDIRYVYNHALKVFIDLEHCPRYTDWIAPLPLLIVMGHDAPAGGNFDFLPEECVDHVGTWCDTVRSIEVSRTPLKNVDYAEFRPGFTEVPPGRHYYIVNVDKRLLFGAYDLQLLSWACCRCEMVHILHNLLAGDWKGDRVYVVANDALKGWEFPGNDELCAELAKSEEKGLFLYAEKHFKGLGAVVDTEDHGIRYLYNHALKEYVDLKHCPVSEEDRACIAPLPLLLTIGNVGDAALDLAPEDDGFEHMGKWCASVRSIEVSKEPLPGVDYPEFRPNFLERKERDAWSGPIIVTE